MKNIAGGIVAAALTAATIAGCGAAADSTGHAPAAKPQTDIRQAVDGCSLNDNRWVTVGDDDRTLVIDGEDDLGYAGLGINKIACLTLALDISDATIARIDSTNSLMGQQEAREGDLDIMWTYHPDNGLDLVITEGGVQS